MSLLRRIVQYSTVSKAFMPYPLGRCHASLPKLNQIGNTYIDLRPISLRYRVTAMIEMSNLDRAAEISRLAVLDKFRVDRDTVFICNSVIGAMCDAKRYDEAISLFNYFFNEFQTLPNTLSCNLIIKAHCDQGRVDDALELYRHVVLDGRLSPGIETYGILTKALVDATRVDEAYDLVRSMTSCNFMVYDILIRGLLDLGKFVKASQILEELKGKVQCRDYHKAIAIFNVSFIKYWFKQGKDEDAMEIYATLEKAQLLGPIVGTIPVERVRRTCYRTMIKFLCEQGNMSEAEKLFAEMFSDDELLAGPDVSTFRAMINGYVKVGSVDDAIKMLNKMKISKLRMLAIH